ncbi:forkhead box protein C2-B, partial [Biomphalaria glabrata]
TPRSQVIDLLYSCSPMCSCVYYSDIGGSCRWDSPASVEEEKRKGGESGAVSPLGGQRRSHPPLQTSFYAPLHPSLHPNMLDMQTVGLQSPYPSSAVGGMGSISNLSIGNIGNTTGLGLMTGLYGDQNYYRHGG